MRISISNIAWDTSLDKEVLALLGKHSIRAIDVAPSKYFTDFASVNATEIRRVKDWWSEAGIEITGMQSLLFGTDGLNLFGPVQVRKRMLEHLKNVCRIGDLLGARRLVFGSPKNRDRDGLDDCATHSIAVEFFSQLGDIAKDYGVIVCLEPNPTSYGANFMTNSVDTALVVSAVNHPAIRMQFDTGALAMNEEDPAAVIATNRDLIGHIHISEPNLVPIGTIDTDHTKTAAAIRKVMPDSLVSIEMLTAKGDSSLPAIESALQFVKKVYGRECNTGVSG